MLLEHLIELLLLLHLGFLELVIHLLEFTLMFLLLCFQGSLQVLVGFFQFNLTFGFVGSRRKGAVFAAIASVHCFII